MTSTRPRFLSYAALLFAFALSSRGLAAPRVDSATRSAARDLGSEGVALLNAGDVGGALPKLEKAYAVLQVPSLALWSARALARSGKLVEAAERYLEATRLSIEGGQKDIQEAAQAEAAKEREELLPRIPKLKIVLVGVEPSEPVQVKIGEELIPIALIGEARPTNPGTFVIAVQVGSASTTAEVTLAEAEIRSVEMRYPGPAEAGSTPGSQNAEERSISSSDANARESIVMKPLGWSLIGVGAASLATGGVLGLLAMDKQSKLACPGNVCSPDQEGDVSSYNTLRMVSGITMIAGGVLAAAGVTCLWLAPGEPEKAGAVKPYAGFGLVGVKGAF